MIKISTKIYRLILANYKLATVDSAKLIQGINLDKLRQTMKKPDEMSPKDFYLGLYRSSQKKGLFSIKMLYLL